MKKQAMSILLIISLLLFFNSEILAEETKELEYFGIAATVTEGANSDEYLVQTKGEKVEEGFVFTPSGPFSSTNIEYQVQLKGEGKVFLKLEETDARGKFIKEVTSSVIDLTNDWETHQLTAELSSTTSQIDVFVLTSAKEELTFSFKNIKINSKYRNLTTRL